MLINKGRIITVLAGHPNDPNWDNLHQDAADMLENFCVQCKFSDNQRKHRHGRFPALSYGISYSGGQTVCLLLFVIPISLISYPQHPQNLHHNKDNTAVLITLVNNLAFMRLAGFASCEL